MKAWAMTGRAGGILQNGSGVFSLSHARCGYILLSTILPAAEHVSRAGRGRRVGRTSFLIRFPGSIMPAEDNHHSQEPARAVQPMSPPTGGRMRACGIRPHRTSMIVTIFAVVGLALACTCRLPAGVAPSPTPYPTYTPYDTYTPVPTLDPPTDLPPTGPSPPRARSLRAWPTSRRAGSTDR